MREAFGGSWLLGFVVLFIVLFSAYLAISVNYTKAFKAKNKIINIIEQNEGYTKTICSNVKNEECVSNSTKTEDKIYKYLSDAGFILEDVDSSRCENEGYELIEDAGYCVAKYCTRDGAYYKVRTFIKIDIPVVWISFTVPINGETKVIYYHTDDDLNCVKN